MTTENQNTAGALLRQGRLRQRLSIAECVKRTHIAHRFIEALEEERWADLPSESHRLGFLKLYARFLGVPADDVVNLYLKKSAAPSETVAAPTPSSSENEKPKAVKPTRQSAGWSPNAIPQIVGAAILLLLLSWVIYHTVMPRMSEQNPMPWTRRRPSQQSRLVVPKSSITNQEVGVKAQADSWLRVTSRKELLFEGILPTGATKSWSGQGPFQFKIGNVHALTLSWNNQPVDILAGAHGSINEIRIPPQ